MCDQLNSIALKSYNENIETNGILTISSPYNSGNSTPMEQLKMYQNNNAANDIDGISEKDSKEENGIEDDSSELEDFKK